jgi:hypothetical protein
MIVATRKLSAPGRLAALVATFAASLLTFAATASAEFGFQGFDGQITANSAGDPYSHAAGHPYEDVTAIDYNTMLKPQPPFEGEFPFPDESVKDQIVELPAGLIGNPNGFERCTMDQLAIDPSVASGTLCPTGSQVGHVEVSSPLGPIAAEFESGVYNMVPPAGAPARLGFKLLGVVVLLDASLRSEGDHGLSIDLRDASQGLALLGAKFSVWGVPADPTHYSKRFCPGEQNPGCESDAPPIPFLTMPTSCTDPGIGIERRVVGDSWEDPGDFKSASFLTHDPPSLLSGETNPENWGPERGIDGCDEVDVKGSLEARPTSRDAESSSGLAVHVEVPNPGLLNAEGISTSAIKKVKVALPQGLTVNPSQAEGLEVCTPAQYASTELTFFPSDKGCPEDSKIGTVSVKTPLLEETIPGDVYVAQQDDSATTQHGAENPFDSFLALYIVLHEPQRGILVKLPGEIDLDNPEHPGQIVTTFDDVPQLPFSTFDFHFREGPRAPLVTPASCGDYTTETEITGWSDPERPIVSKSSFQIDRGIGGGPCPQGGVPPFKPGFSAGSINNNAKSYSPFVMRLTRNDGEQDMTRFSAILPPGVLGKLAGVGKCPEAAIAAAGAKAHTGRQELASPSCPQSSKIGRTLVGAGVGSVLTYVPGSLYLAGPWHGDPLSVVAITPAVAGPFDVGTVLVREALTLNPESAEVEVDGAASEPIPHILAGIPLKLRDLRVYVDRPEFTLNPTSCDPSSAKATLFGSFADVFNPADDVPVALSDRYQAANCAALGFKPRLALNLKGGTRRGGHPALRAVLRAREADANIGAATVTLPKSAFLDQAHIRTICTRVQFAAGEGSGAQCPKAARYGFARAITPLLDEPIEGPVYLRSSNHKLPDLVAALHGLVDVNIAGRIDSFKGGIRSSFESVPDAPVSKFVLTMQGGHKGLVVNSRNLCAGVNRASARFTGQNGKPHDFRPVVKPSCGSKRRSADRHG